MNTSIKTTIAALVLSASFAGTASAMAPVQSLQGTVQSVVGSEGQVHVTLNDGVATLFGYLNNGSTEQNVKQAVKNYPGVEKIVDLIADS